MVSTLCDRINEKNEEEYGTRVNVWAPMILANLYSDRTHFVYELLQNAEDACERAREKGQKGLFYVRFLLYPDRLEVRHNGIRFDQGDVTGICGIVEAEKDETTLQIGKFGIGFKSVYAYTISPEVHGGDPICLSCTKCAFRIKDYVHPYAIRSRKDLKAEETLFVIRFDREEVKKAAHSEIESRLRNLGIRTLLFLNNLEEISYETASTSGRYLRRSEAVNGAKLVSLHYVAEQEKRTEKWLVFEKALDRDKSRKLEIAYLLAYDPDSKKERIIPARNMRLFAYFRTETETHLRFLIQGPYNTTPARDNIKRDEWNQKLIEETATLVAESLPRVKALGLLDVGFLRTLPIDTLHFTQEGTLFKPIYKLVKEKLLSDEPLLPSYDGSFATADQALIARGGGLFSLLSSEQLDMLLGRKGSKWLDENITEARTPELRRYLMGELQITEVDPEFFARKFNEEFMGKQSDQWVKSFYSFLSNQKALWRARSYYESPGVLRSKPIIRLSDDSHTAPFDDEGNPLAYLPHKDPKTRRLFPDTVKDSIAHDKNAMRFLKALGLNEPDKATGIMKLVLPLYKGGKAPSEDENVKHLEWIVETLEECKGGRRDDLLAELKETPFLNAIKASSQRKGYKKPIEIHLGEKYTGKKSLETFFEGNEEIWFLDERYLAVAGSRRLVQRLSEMGCKAEIQIRYEEPNYLGYVIIAKSRGWHRRGLDGFDPDCNIEGLEHALQNVNIERSKIVWHIAKKYCQSIYGEVESSTRQSYEGSTTEWMFSEMGRLLTQYKWLPDTTSSSFHEPSRIMLSQLPEDFGKDSPEAKYAAGKLGFQPELEKEIQEVLEKTPEVAKEIVEIYMTASPEMQQRMVESVRAISQSGREAMKLRGMEPSETIIMEVSPSPSELLAEFEKSLKQERSTLVSTEDRTWTGPTPEEVDRMQELEVEALEKLHNETQYIVKGRKEASYTKVKGEEEFTPKDFLLEQYEGHCQVCYTRLDLGPEKDPYFETYHLIEKRRLYGTWSDQDFNVLCLCPNCHALMKYGGGDLEEILKRARRVAEGEEAPEEVEERRGDFYIVQIAMAGKKANIFYTPIHMAKISAFVKMAEDKADRSIYRSASALTSVESREIYQYKCHRCGRLHSVDDFNKERFCRKCGTYLLTRARRLSR